jgi:hypothetical protein
LLCKPQHYQLLNLTSPEKWQEILSDLITDPKELLANLKLDTTANPIAALAAKGAGAVSPQGAATLCSADRSLAIGMIHCCARFGPAASKTLKAIA